jgi:hypothetical protein
MDQLRHLLSDTVFVLYVGFVNQLAVLYSQDIGLSQKGADYDYSLDAVIQRIHAKA